MEWKKTKTNKKTKTKGSPERRCEAGWSGRRQRQIQRQKQRDHLSGGVKQVGVEEDGVSGLKFHKDVRVTLASLVDRF